MKQVLILIAMMTLVFAACNTATDAPEAAKEAPKAEAPAETPTPAAPVTASVSAAWWTAYVSVQEALADDNFENAKTALSNLLTASEGDIKTAVATASEAADIENARTAFKPVSDAVKDGDLPEGHVVAYCPMAFNDTGAHWVQKDGTLMNPYFGASMLHCGAVTRKAGEAGGGDGEATKHADDHTHDGKEKQDHEH